jgi:hypothetical protein
MVRTMLIVNKDKQANAEDKQIAARKLRRAPLVSAIRSMPKRHDQNLCPVCGHRIEKTAHGGRRKQCCSNCGACIQKNLICKSCGTQRVWQSKKGAACRGCGNKHAIELCSLPNGNV